MGLGEALGGVVGGFLGNNAAKQDRSNAKKNMQSAIAAYEQLGYPPDLSKQLVLKEYAEAGQLTPELEQEIMLEDSQFKSIQEDPQLRELQLEALNKFKQQSETGLGAEERAAFNQMQQAIRQDQRAQQGQILADAQRRGQGGGGAALIAQLQASQSGADQAASQGNELAALIAQRVRQGSQDMSGAAQGLRSQDYQVSSDRARAIDERNRFLNQNSVARQTRNVAARNDAQAANLSNRQDVANRNVGQYNTELNRQVDAQANQYNQGLQRAAGISGQYRNMADYLNKQADAKAQAAKDTGKGIGGIVEGGAKLFGGF